MSQLDDFISNWEEHLADTDRYEVPRALRASIRASRKAHGLCIMCGEKTLPNNKNFCKLHRNKHSEYTKRSRHNHLLHDKAYREQRKKAGICVRCGKLRGLLSIRLCDSCLERKRQARKRR